MGVLTAGQSPTSWVMLGLAVVCLLPGCQLGALTDRSIPAPPPILDTEMLENVSFQSPDDDSIPEKTTASPDESQRVAKVIVTGNTTIPTHHLMRNIRTRPGRFFDPDKLKQDVDQLWQMPEISRINGPFIKQTPEGVVVTLEVVERKAITQIKFIGNRGIADRTLKKETGLEDGKPLNIHKIRMAKTKIEELYKEKGYPRTQVEIKEGTEKGASEVIFLISEDEKQRIWKTEFEGNSIASDARLRHLVQSKPGILMMIGGLVNRDEIEQDVVRLTTYYRSLGFFNARIGRDMSESNDGRWLTIRFIIDEGPRYRVRKVAFIGNSSYTEDQLRKMLNLKPDDDATAPEFNVAKMNSDVVALRDLYGSQGFISAKINAEPRFLEEPGLLDIVYKIDEGQQYYARNINVHFVGETGITRRRVVVDRVEVRPGDLIDSTKILMSERRLGASSVFGIEGGQRPRIVIRPVEPTLGERIARGSRHGASRSTSYR